PEVGNPSGEPLVVATTHAEESGAVVALGLDGEERWRHPFDAMTRPEILGDVVMTSDREHVVALDARSGEELWRKPLESLAYVGATRRGDTIVFVTSVGAAGGATRVGHVRAVGARSGDARWEWEIQGVLGRPQVWGPNVFVPWDRQNIAILDVTTGLEKARLRSTDDVIAWVNATSAGLFYGGRGMYRFTERSHTGTKEESTYRPSPLPEAPREPLVEDDGFFPVPGTRSARGRIRLHYAPAPSEDPTAVAVHHDQFYFTYYRYVFAFDGEGTLRWARMLEQDVIVAKALESGLFTVGEQGAFRLLDWETGAERWSGGSERELASAGVDLGAFAPAPSGELEARDPRIVLTEIAGDPDNRLVPARAYAIELLAQMDDPEITRLLLDLYAQRHMPGALKEAIANVLRTRATGTEALVEALDQRYDYLADTPAPPLALLVPALLEQQKTEAVGGLVRHMLDHETPMAVLPLVVRGVVELGDESIVPALRSFLVLYHADSTFQEKPEALAVAAEGIFRRGGDEGRELLQALVADGTTVGPVSTAINGLFEREAQEAEAAARAEAEAAARAAEEAARRERAARPTRLSQAAINEVFVAQTEAMRTCVEGELERNPRLGQVRIVFVLLNDGTATEVRFAPNTPEFVACMEPVVAALEFPAFVQRRQRASFTVNLRGDSSEQVAEAPEDRFWWSRAQRRAGEGEIGRPWWEVRQAPRQPGAATPQPERPSGGEGEGSGEGGDQPWWMEGGEGGGEAPPAGEGG
ncbi:MAG TPA: PQQ-binding-like beta-propeller repeat protein, partial [Polyangiaceae bacterium LLY-WYZ-15_(1-7)]|nr:PQQ-binding-like beta-propeller repeat protein [Polyangiaceae bacterium LLY-WYZ-15_(1-7)]